MKSNARSRRTPFQILPTSRWLWAGPSALLLLLAGCSSSAEKSAQPRCMDPKELNSFLTYMQQDYETALLKARQEYEADLLQSQHLRQQGVAMPDIDKLRLQNYEAALNIIIEVHSPERIIAQNAKACALAASQSRKN